MGFINNTRGSSGRKQKYILPPGLGTKVTWNKEKLWKSLCMIIWKPHKLKQLEHLHPVNTYPFSNFNSVTVQVWEWIFVVVNFDDLAQASDFQIERRQVVFLCWMQDSNPEGLWNPIFSRLNACWQTDWAIEDQAKDLNSTASPYDQQAFSPPDPTAIWYSHLAVAIYIFFVVNFDALAQASDFHSKGNKLSSSAECRIRTHRVSETQSSADWMPADKPTELSRIGCNYLSMLGLKWIHVSKRGPRTSAGAIK